MTICRQSAKDIEFEWTQRDSHQNIISVTKVSIVDYFEQRHNITLKYPNMPCLEVGNPGNAVKIPLELCRMVPHQRLRRLMTNSEKSQMTRVSGQQSPKDRLEMCQDFIVGQFRTGEISEENKPILSEFEITVNKNLLTVNSKVIPPPTLIYGSNSNLSPQNGEWEMHKTRVHFLKAERYVLHLLFNLSNSDLSLENWILINMSFTDSFEDRYIDEFCHELCEQAKEMGMSAEDPNKKILIRSFIPKTTFAGMKTRLELIPNLKMILFITPDKSYEYSDEIYSEIKLLGDVETMGGLTTQCVNINSIWDKRSNRKKFNRSYFRQLMLKVNPKLGGTNFALKLDSSSMPSIFRCNSLMIIGADVNHPAPADRMSPSIAALVGSYDNEYSNYYTTVSMQPKSREEMIKYLDIMVIELLNNYKNKQKGNLPDQIIFYRDGVSEGQFQHVIDNEYPLLTQAFSKIKVGYNPKLTFIVVQKRHHTRFMTADTKKNVPPGTVVEKQITHKRDFDFYLCSHAGKIVSNL